MSENLSQLIQRRIKELNIRKAEIARRTGLSRTYITDISNGTGNTQSGEYRPPPETVTKLAKALEISEAEVTNAIGYASRTTVQHDKPKTIKDLISRLSEMGFDIHFDGDLTNFTSDDLEDLIDDIKAKLIVKSQRNKKA